VANAAAQDLGNSNRGDVHRGRVDIDGDGGDEANEVRMVVKIMLSFGLVVVGSWGKKKGKNRSLNMYLSAMYRPIFYSHYRINPLEVKTRSSEWETGSRANLG